MLFTMKLVSIILLGLISQHTYSSTSDVSVCSNNETFELNPKNISKSHIILQGTLVSDTKSIVDSIGSGIYQSTQLNLIRNSTIKGGSDIPDVVEIEYSTRPINLRPCSHLILELDLNEVIVFLKPVIVNGEHKYYFEASSNSIIQNSNQRLNQITQTTNSQKEFITNFDRQFIVKDKELHTTITQLIKNIKFENTQQLAIQKLIALGDKAVPLIIYSMDNYLKVDNNEIKIHQKNGTVKTYSPDLVVDVLAIVLNSITGMHYGYIYNGASDLERAQTVSAWRTYLMN